jgi:predicted methyltransferase
MIHSGNAPSESSALAKCRCVGYASWMASLGARSLILCVVAAWPGCSHTAVAPRASVAPVESRPPTVSSSGSPPAVEPVVALPPEVATAPAEPVPALPPCPGDPQRDEHQKPDHVVQLAELAESMTVVDLGSGSGYFLCRLARAVGSRGRVIATEIDRSLVAELSKRAAREQLSNVEVVLAPSADVGIAPGSADRILVVDVWHHLADRKRYAARIARALSPEGKIIIVDFKPNRSGHGIAPERVLAELSAGGIDGAVVPEDLADQYVIVGSVRASSSGGKSTR